MSDTYIKRPNRSLQFYATLFLVVLYLPALFLPLFSFNDSIYVKFPPIWEKTPGGPSGA